MTRHPSRRGWSEQLSRICFWATALGCVAIFFLVTGQTAATAQEKESQKQAAADKPKAGKVESPTAAKDSRLSALKNLDGYFPFKPYNSRADWDQRADQLRRQLLVATGLWPMPERTPPRAIVHGKVDREEYTVEKVILESWPGHYITGNLYRPKGKSGKLAAVLCPHGHWNDGRFYDAGAAGVKKQIEIGAEKYDPSGRYPLQARCVQLARMGCVVFHYDMLGYADSVQIPHSIAHGFRERRPGMEGKSDWGFFSPQAELHLQSIIGLQTYNSIRALDWVSELPEVDASRIGVTGASGGGTQTFVLCAIDPRPLVAFPAVMVSTAMQGGCTCENCSYLRVGTGNIEIAALIAPRPLGMTAANDWTKEMETKGFPELKQHYKLLGVPENVTLAALLQFDHNYNYPSRVAMYEWMNKHLSLGQKTPIDEQDFKPLSREELTVWNDEHPRPSGDSIGEAYERKLLKQMTDDARQQMAALRPDNSLKEFERVVGGAWDVLIGRRLPKPASVQFNTQQREQKGSHEIERVLIQNTTEGEQVQVVFLTPREAKNRTVIWLDERGKQGLFASSGEPTAAVRKLLDAGVTVVGADLLSQGETPAGETAEKQPSIKHPRNFAGFTYGYNYPLFAKRVHDVLSTIAVVRDRQPTKSEIYLVGFGPAGAWAAAAAAQSGDEIFGLAADLRSFRFADLKSIGDADFLPGAVKYGDVDALLALAQPKYRLQFGASDWPELVQVAANRRGTPYATSVSERKGDDGKMAAAEWITELVPDSERKRLNRESK